VVVEPRSLVWCQWQFGGQLGIFRNFSGLACLDSFLYFGPLYFASACSWQIFLPDFITANALGGGNLLRQSFDIEADYLFRVDNLFMAQTLEVGHDYCVQAVAAGPWLCFQSHDRELFDVG